MTDQAMAVDTAAPETAQEFARWLTGAVAGELAPGWEESWTKGIERRDVAMCADLKETMRKAVLNLGVPSEGCPANVKYAYDLLVGAIERTDV